MRAHTIRLPPVHLLIIDTFCSQPTPVANDTPARRMGGSQFSPTYTPVWTTPALTDKHVTEHYSSWSPPRLSSHPFTLDVVLPPNQIRWCGPRESSIDIRWDDRRTNH